ncbi:MAG: cyclic nucleotide-binding domain-containing protein [Anaerolineales bacterium]
MLDTLAYIPLFQDLDPSQSDLIDSLFERFEYPQDTVLFEQGSPATHLYLITKGVVAIQYKPYDGPSLIVTRLRAGDLCGWSAVVGGKVYTSGCVSLSEVEAVRILGSDLWSLAKTHPELGKVVLNKLASIVSPRWENAHVQVQALLEKKFGKKS